MAEDRLFCLSLLEFLVILGFYIVHFCAFLIVLFSAFRTTQSVLVDIDSELRWLSWAVGNRYLDYPVED